MINYTLIRDAETNLYYALENGVKVTNAIFTDKSDFESNLISLGLYNESIVEVKNS